MILASYVIYFALFVSFFQYKDYQTYSNRLQMIVQLYISLYLLIRFRPFHKIKLEKPYEYVGYGDAIFKHQSKIDYPGSGAQESGRASEMGTGVE